MKMINMKNKSIRLERLIKQTQLIINKQEIEQGIKIPIQYDISEKINELILHLIGSIPAHKQTRQISFQTPMTWKDHFKMRYRNKKWMRWWIKKHPIQFGRHCYEIDKMTVFPNFEVPHFLSNKKTYVEYLYREV